MTFQENVEPSGLASVAPLSAVFAERRKRVSQALGEAVLVLFAAPEMLRNNDVHHEYRQQSDFYYLTGLDEPNAALVLSGGGDAKLTLFVLPRDAAREVWDGPRIGVEGANSSFGASHAHEFARLEEELPKLLLGHRRVVCRLGEAEEDERRILKALRRARRLARKTQVVPVELWDSSTLLHEMRRVKADGELSLMRRAAAITAEAHRAAMKAAGPGKFEYEVEAELRSVFRRCGAERPAYAPIVGSGPNATILHYVKNSRRMEQGDLLLIDAGCEYGYYASDVTRTFPVGGTFSSAQKRIYEIVLDAQRQAIAHVRPGITFEDLHAISLRVITSGLIELGMIAGPLEIALSQELYKPFFMHGTGHYLGMDVHDVGSYHEQGKARPFEPGVVLTVEPGIYISPSNDQVPLEYRGIGVRIEDDIVVTSDGHENLTAAIPKSIEEIEACMKV